MRASSVHFRRGFTLMETVIAIGVLAVLLTAFMAVFGPATQKVRRAINVQEADRLAATLEKELAILRPTQSATTDSPTSGKYATAFNKAFYWLKESGSDDDKMILVYQYRGNPTKMRDDGTMEPFTGQGEPGKDYMVQSVARRGRDTGSAKDKQYFGEDIKALEGRVFVVVARQLVMGPDPKDNTRQVLTPGVLGEIKGSSMTATAGNNNLVVATKPDDYGDAVIAFTAMFFDMPTSVDFITKTLKLTNLKLDEKSTAPATADSPLREPVFTRNLGVRR